MGCVCSKPRKSKETNGSISAKQRCGDKMTEESITGECLEESYWIKLPESLLLHVFIHLPAESLLSASTVCKLWHRVAQDELLWRNLVYHRWQIPEREARRPHWKASWKELYREYHFHVPCVMSQELQGHTDEVWNVSFSNDGCRFATASKDGSVKVWNTEFPSKEIFSKQVYSSSSYVQRTIFSPDDDKLLVSLRFQKTIQGRIHVYALDDDFRLLLDTVNEPSQSFGAWLTNDYIITGCSSDIDEFVADRISTINITKVPKVLQMENETCELFCFKGHSDSLIQKIMFAFPRPQGTGAASTGAATRSSRWSLPLRKCQTPIIQISFYNNTVRTFLEEQLSEGDIFLIFRTSTIWFCYSHQIWIKRLSLEVILDLLERENVEEEEQLLDTVDYQFEMKGFISDMNLSPDHRYLYVNCRKWVEDYSSKEVELPPVQALTKQFDIHVIDLLTMEDLGDLKTVEHGKAVTECSLIDLDIQWDYLASGAEDRRAYIWDLHSLACVATLPHEDIVNSVAFHPSDPEMVVTVSDDCTAKVWRSRHRMEELRGKE